MAPPDWPQFKAWRCLRNPGRFSHSINKAFTSLACKLPTHRLGQDAQPGGQFYGLSNTVEGRIITFAGGVPLRSGHELVGAIGVSGGTAEQDREIAEAAEVAL